MSTIDGVNVVNGNPYVKSKAGRKTGRFMAATAAAVPATAALVDVHKTGGIRNLLKSLINDNVETLGYEGKFFTKIKMMVEKNSGLKKVWETLAKTKIGRVALIGTLVAVPVLSLIGLGGLVGRIADGIQNRKAKKIAKAYNA